LEEVRESLRYISENGSIKDKESAKAVASIFSRTKDGQARDLCLSALMRIGNKVATREMLRIYSDASVPAQWRTATAEYLKIDPPQQSKTVDVLAEPQQNGSQP
jgi:HEAT repeat protein